MMFAYKVVLLLPHAVSDVVAAVGAVVVLLCVAVAGSTADSHSQWCGASRFWGLLLLLSCLCSGG